MERGQLLLFLPMEAEVPPCLQLHAMLCRLKLPFEFCVINTQNKVCTDKLTNEQANHRASALQALFTEKWERILL
jgi:hypothetical protein